MGTGSGGGSRKQRAIPRPKASTLGATLRLAAAFLLAGSVAAAPACAGRTPGGSPPSPKAGTRWAPSSAVGRSAPLPEDPDLKAPREDFTGSDSCAECHKDRVKSLSVSFHANLVLKNSGSVGCEECHGPGLDHVGFGDERGIRDPRKAPREQSNAVCLRCHAAVLDPRRPVSGHPLWVAERKVACADCHRVHVDRESRVEAHGKGPFADAEELEAAGAAFVEPARCIQCHPDYHPEMDRSGHANLAFEGKACAECHGNGSLHAASGGLKNLILEPTKQEATKSD